jgi:phospholipid/cholesterol/gamma-HCH transport system substrate-binding protein
MIGRLVAIAALGVALIAIVVIVVSGGSTYQVHAIFQNASQLVTGDQVEVSGNAVGSISKIVLTPNGEADLTLTISDPTVKPLRAGTIAMVRQASQSGIANRYVDLDLGPGGAPAVPSGGQIPASQTTSAVDLDELFDSLNAQTRQGVRDVFQGSASQYAGRGQQAQLAWQYLSPSIATASLLFHELNRDTKKFTNFIVTSNNLVTDLANRQADLSALVVNGSRVFTALANQSTNLGLSLQRLPGFMRLANTTFVNVRNALPDLTDLINASRTIAAPAPGYPKGKLYALLAQLEPLAIDAVPTVRDLANIISRPGPNNDLIELNRLAVPLAQATVGGRFGVPKVKANGKLRPGAFTVSQQALKESIPELATAAPYAPDLTGWFEGYSHPGLYDANGAVSRVSAVISIATLENGTLNLCGGPIQQLVGNNCSLVNNLLTNPALFGARNSLAGQLLTTGQGDRCPGSMERGPTGNGKDSAMYYPESGYPCDPNQVPTGK